MSAPISISLWFDHQANEALERYATIFPNSHILSRNDIVTDANLSKIHFVGINGGPTFTPNPSISMMVIAENQEEITKMWAELSKNGTPLMELGEYPWSPYYGWIQDQYHINWQLYLGKLSDVNQQKIVPTLMFTQQQNGKCQEAVQFYKSVFTDFESQGVLLYPEGELKGLVQHTQFKMNDQVFMAMDGGPSHEFTFNEGVSFIIQCKDQKEIDYYWDAMTALGEESQCGWCKDQFGVSWQIAPENMGQLITSPSASAALMKMKKIIIEDLK